MIEEVTAFIVRRSGSHYQMLLLNHPPGGYQIPAGTVQEGETAADAAMRQAYHIAGLSQLTIHTYLGSAQNWLPPERRLVTSQAEVYDSAAEGAGVQAHLSPGTVVQVLGSSKKRVRVVYAGGGTDAVPYQEGWVDEDMLTDSRRRSFFRLACGPCAADEWTAQVDGESLSASWAPLSELPPLPYDQAEWLSFLDLPFQIHQPPAGE